MPFDPAAARAARELLGLSPAMTARAMGSHGVFAVPPQVIAWETGELLPSEGELVALARALWCPPGQLMGGRAAGIRDHRLALDLPQEEVARLLGLTPRVYAQMEVADRWSGSEDQTYLLAQALRLTPRALLTATRRTEELHALLQRAVDGRWQPQAKAVARLIPTLDRDRIDHALRVVHDEGHTTGSLWGGDNQAEESPAPGPEELAEQFWLLVGP